jgi:hypothetical protein
MAKQQKGRFTVRNLGDDEDESEPKVAIPVDTVLLKKPSRFTVRHVPPEPSPSPSPLYDRLSSIISQLEGILQEIPRRGGKKTKRRKSLRKKRTHRRRRR